MANQYKVRQTSFNLKVSKSKRTFSTLVAVSLVGGQSLATSLPASANTCNAGSISALKEATFDFDCSIINITNNLSFSSDADMIQIPRDVTIQGAVTIDANNHSQIFWIDETYMNGDEEEIELDGDTNENGALDVNIFGLILREGTAQSDGDFTDRESAGGAIVQGDTEEEIYLRLENTRFLNNFANTAGGAIALATGFVEVTGNSRFENNESSIGGAIVVGIGTKELPINIPDIGPGISDTAILLSGNVTFSNNHATNNVGYEIFEGGGGAIIVGEGSLVVTGVAEFNNNISYGNGGAVAVPVLYSTHESSISFTGNIAGGNGGALSSFNLGYDDFGLGFIFISGEADFVDNEAEGAGGGIASWAVFIQDSADVSFIDNNANGPGGAIASFGTIIGFYDFDSDPNPNVAYANFVNNISENNGGAISAYIFGSQRDASLKFINNIAVNGGAIWLDESAGYYGIQNAYFANNQAENGGAIYANDEVFITNSTFYKNEASLDGGAIFTHGNGSQVIFSTFLDNTAVTSGTDALPGQSITSGGIIRIFGNIFASTLSTLPQLRISSGEGDYTDLGGNIMTSTDDSFWIDHPSSKVVSLSELGLASSPQRDSRYPISTEIITLAPSSIAVDAIDTTLLADNIALLIGELPTRDQRGAERTGLLDAGSYEYGVRENLVVIAPKVVLPAAPTRVSVKTMGKKTLRIDWALPTSAGTGKIIKYEVWRNGQKIATIASNKRYFIDKGLDPNQSYTYRIVSVGTQGSSIKSTTSPAIYPKR